MVSLRYHVPSTVTPGFTRRSSRDHHAKPARTNTCPSWTKRRASTRAYGVPSGVWLEVSTCATAVTGGASKSATLATSAPIHTTFMARGSTPSGPSGARGRCSGRGSLTR